ncbi:MAG: hypothetical protein ACLFUZ_02710 [Candidatus Micrarchaeia archaeon]
MNGCPVEQAQNRILLMIAENGDGAVQGLAKMYNEDKIGGGAMKGLVFQNVGKFARGTMIEAIGKSGSLLDVENVLMHLLGHENAWKRKAYYRHSVKTLGEERVFIHQVDNEMEIREKALFAVEEILARKGGGVSRESGGALVKCAIADPSGKARATATRIVARYADSESFRQLFAYMVNAEKAGEFEFLERSEDAVKIMVAEMKLDRPRRSFLKPLVGLSNASEGMWDFAVGTIMHLFQNSDMKREIQDVVLREKIKLDSPNKIENRNASNRLGSLIRAMGKELKSNRGGNMTAEAEMKGEVMRPPKNMQGIASVLEEPVEVPRGPVVTAIRKVGRRIRKILPKGRHR